MWKELNSGNANELGDARRSFEQGSLSCLTRADPLESVFPEIGGNCRKSIARLAVFDALLMALENPGELSLQGNLEHFHTGPYS